MDFTVTELDHLLDAVNFRLRMFQAWQHDLCETNEKAMLLDGMDELIQENLDIIREYQYSIDRLDALRDKLSSALFGSVSPTA